MVGITFLGHMGSKKIMPDLGMVRTARLKELEGVFLRIWAF